MLTFHTYDVFTDRAFSGNPLAIVEGADGLSTKQMQTIAREFNLSETIFIQTPESSANTAKVRIFFPTAEIPFAGHPTIGCALHLAQGDMTITLEEVAGLVPISIKDALAEFTAPVVPYPITPPGDRDKVAQALGLNRTDLGVDLPQAHEGGPRFFFVSIATLDGLAKAHPIEPHWSDMMNQHGVDSMFLYCKCGDHYRTRMFSPTAGIPEDPATGSASAILASQLLVNGEIHDGQTTITLKQGVEMGRPSDIRMIAVVSAGQLSQVRIAGRAVPISSGTIRIPEDE